MLGALVKALTQLRERTFWRVVSNSVLITATTFIGLYIVVWLVLSHVSIAETWWIDMLVDVLGGLTVIALTWFLFPAIVSLVMSFFLDRIVDAVERSYYPQRAPPTPLPIWQNIAVALKFTTVTVLVNLIVLPLYLIPGLNLMIFYGVNGYLLSREYFELVALRRLTPANARALRRANALRLFIAGLLMTALLTIPLVNLLAPLIAAAFMVHLVVALAGDYQPSARPHPSQA
jgi:CysZ protein